MNPLAPNMSYPEYTTRQDVQQQPVRAFIFRPRTLLQKLAQIQKTTLEERVESDQGGSRRYPIYVSWSDTGLWEPFRPSRGTSDEGNRGEPFGGTLSSPADPVCVSLLHSSTFVRCLRCSNSRLSNASTFPASPFLCYLRFSRHSSHSLHPLAHFEYLADLTLNSSSSLRSFSLSAKIFASGS